MYKRNNLEQLIQKASINNVDLTDKKVILRAALNVPINEGKIEDESRIKAALPMIQILSKPAKKLIILSHLGRPEGRDEKLSLKPIAQKISQLTNIEIKIAEDLSEVREIENGVVMLENIRFFEGEESKDIEKRTQFASELAMLGDLYVNDAFPDYREAASTFDIVKFLPSYLGNSFEAEIESLAKFSNAGHPIISVLGGAKLSEKLDALLSLAEISDKLIIGGAMAYTLMKSIGQSVGNSKVEEDKIDVAREIMSKYSNKVLLPTDHLTVRKFEEPLSGEQVEIKGNISEEDIAVDIGSETIRKYKETINSAKTILWNGPMGVFEWKATEMGTKAIGEAISQNTNAYSLVGGGDTLAAIEKFKLGNFGYVSMGGGALLALLAYDKFPVLDVILDKYE